MDVIPKQLVFSDTVELAVRIFFFREIIEPSLIFPVRAVSVEPQRHVAVVAENLEPIRKPLVLEPGGNVDNPAA